MLGGGGPDKMEQAMAMAAQNPHLEAENTKDFLALWTKMAVTCFERCVTNTQNSMIDQNSKEYSCIENCVGKHVEANHRIVKKFTESQEEFTKMQQKYEDEKMREYKDKGIFNENMELIPKKPKTPEEMELEALETAAPKFVVDAYKWAKGQA